MKNEEFMVCALTEMSPTKDGSHGFDYGRFAPVVKVRTNYFRSHFFCQINFPRPTKGQLISKCPFGLIVWTKVATKLFLDFCPEFFYSFLGASWKLFGLHGDLVCNIIIKAAYLKPPKAFRKPLGRYKIF